MELYHLVIIAVVLVFLLRRRGPRKTLAQQTEEFNRNYYADKQPRRR